MPLPGFSVAEARANRRAVEFHGTHYFKSDWMQNGDEPDRSPAIFLVEQEAHGVLDAHFHRTNQFQLFVSGSGRIGGHGVETLTVHYAGAYTGYGPIVAGNKGLAYFTIRSGHEAGALFLKDSMPLMRKGPRRGITSGTTALSSADDLRDLPYPRTREIVPLAPDGLGATLFTLPPGASLVPDRVDAAFGEFVLVLGGVAGKADWASLFVPAAEPWPEIAAGPEGAEMIVLSMPHKDPRFLGPRN